MRSIFMHIALLSTLLFWSPPSFAEEGAGHGADHAATGAAHGEEHGEEHVAGGDHGGEHGEGHHSGPNWQGLIQHGYNLVIFLGILGYLASKPINNALKNRQLTIQQNLESSNTLRREAQIRFEELEKRMGQFEAEVAKLRAEGQAEAEREAQQIATQTQKDIEHLQRTAEKTIRDELVQARRQLQQDAIRLAISLSEEQIRNQSGAEQDHQLAQSLLKSIRDGGIHG